MFTECDRSVKDIIKKWFCEYTYQWNDYIKKIKDSYKAMFIS